MTVGTAAGPLFGRDDELACLSDLLARAARGYGDAVLIEGEPGAGKTSLVQVLEEQASTAGFTVLRGCCDEVASAFPLLPVLDALGVHRRGEDTERQEIRRLLRSGAGAHQDAVPAVIERLLGLVETACGEHPVLLSLDDLQWADDASALWWQRLARYAAQLPLLLVGAVRTRAAGAAVDALRRGHLRREAPVLRLGPLDTAALGALAGHQLGAPPGPRLSRLLARTGGSPLCAVEFLAQVSQERLLHPVEDGGPVLDLAADLEGSTLDGAVRSRIGRLRPEQREFLQTLSVLGPEFGTEDALAVLDGPAREVAPRFADAQGAGLLGHHGTATAFRNPLLQQSLYQQIPLSLRALLHARAAERLEAAGASTDRVLQQLSKAAAASDAWASPGSWARTWLEEHAEALVNRAPAVAADLLPPLLDPAAPGGRLHLAVANALQRVQRHEEVAVLCRQLLAAPDSDPATVAEAGYHVSIDLHRAGRLTEAVELTEQILVRDGVPLPWVAALHAQRSVLEHHTGRPEEAFRHADLAIELGRSCEAWFAVGLAGWFSSHFVAATDPLLALRRIDEATEALRRDPALGFLQAMALAGRLQPLQTLDRAADLEDTVESLRRTAGHSGVMPFTATLSLARLRYEQGRWDEATAEIDHLTDEDPAVHFPLYAVHGMLAVIAAHRGDDAALRRHLEACADMPDGEYDLDLGQWRRLARAVAAGRAGDPATAVAVLAERLDPEHRPERMRDQGLRFHWLPYLVRFALAAQDRPRAELATEACRHEAERGPVPYWRWSADHCAALLAGDGAALVEVAAYYQRTDRPLEHALALHDAALAHRTAGDGPAAEAALSQAMAGYRRLGMPCDANGPACGWESLTATEQRIARLAARAMSNPQIAAELNLPRRTVQTHVSRILGKLRLRSRVELPHHVPALAAGPQSAAVAGYYEA